MYFTYGETEVSYLRQKDKRLCEVIDRIGHIDREVDLDLFSSVAHHIIGQQISTKAQTTTSSNAMRTRAFLIPALIATPGKASDFTAPWYRVRIMT